MEVAGEAEKPFQDTIRSIYSWQMADQWGSDARVRCEGSVEWRKFWATLIYAEVGITKSYFLAKGNWESPSKCLRYCLIGIMLLASYTYKLQVCRAVMGLEGWEFVEWCLWRCFNLHFKFCYSYHWCFQVINKSFFF